MDINDANYQKWQKQTEIHQIWDNPKARKIQHLEALQIIQWLKQRQLNSGTFLEIGCGNGLVGKLIVDYLQRSKLDFSYEFTDLITACLSKAKQQFGSKLPDQARFTQLDVYKLDEYLPTFSQDVVISTGFASAATYKQAVPGVARVIKPGGILIADFINHFSLPVILTNSYGVIQVFRKYRQTSSKYYHCGIIGIKDYFNLFGLHLQVIKGIGWLNNPLLVLAIFRKLP